MTVKKVIVDLTYAIKQLDTASGELYNAVDNISRVDKAYLLPTHIKSMIDKLDITLIDSIKHELEQLLEEE